MGIINIHTPIVNIIIPINSLRVINKFNYGSIIIRGVIYSIGMIFDENILYSGGRDNLLAYR